jgi:uridine kinase
MERNRGILIGIAGGSGSGKTMVSNAIYNELGSEKVVIVEQDAYYKDLSNIPISERHLRNFDHPDAFDNELLIQQLNDLLHGKVIDYPVYDYATHSRKKESIKIGTHQVIVVEGILALEDAHLREMMDIKVYVDVDADIRFIRRLVRDIKERGRSLESVVEQYEKTVRPMHLQFVEPSKRYADIIIPGGGKNLVAIDLLKTKIKDLI